MIHYPTLSLRRDKLHGPKGDRINESLLYTTYKIIYNYNIIVCSIALYINSRAVDSGGGQGGQLPPMNCPPWYSRSV